MKKKQLISILLAVSVCMSNVPVWGMEEEQVLSETGENSIMVDENNPELEDMSQLNGMYEVLSKEESEEEVQEEETQEEETQKEKTQEEEIQEEEIQEEVIQEEPQEQTDSLIETDIIDQQMSSYDSNADAIDFPDERVREFLVEQWDRNSDNILSEEELDSVDSFWLSSSWVDLGTKPLNLEGLQYLKNLNSISIDLGNQIEIEDITVLDKIVENRDMENLTIENAGLTECSFIEKAKSIESLNLSNNNLQDISSLNKMGTILYIDLSHNNIQDISVISNIRFTYLYMAYNDIEDITPFTLVDLSDENGYLVNVDFSHNKIATLPETWSNLLWMVNLDLSYNNLSSVKALYPRFVKNYAVKDVSYGTDISNNQGLTIESVFNELFDDRSLSVLVGNKVELPSLDEIADAYTDYGKKDDLMNMVDFQLGNSEIAEFAENHTVQGKRSGNTEITVTLNNCVKTIQLEVMGTIEPMETVSEETQGIQAVFDGGCAVWNEEGTLWDIQDIQGKKVTDRVTSYVADVVYSRDRKEKWSNYYVLNEDNELVYYSKESPHKAYDSKVLYQNVKEFKLDWESKLMSVLTTDDELYDCYTGEKVADSVEEYMCDGDVIDGNKVCRFLVYTQNKEIINNQGIVETNVDEIYLSSLGTCFRKGNTICTYNKVYGNNGNQSYVVNNVTDNAEKILGDNQFLDLQGRRCLWQGKWGTDDSYSYDINILDEKSHPYPIMKTLDAYPNPTGYLDIKKQLWAEIFNSEENRYEDKLIATNVDDAMVMRNPILGVKEVVYILNNQLLSLEGDVLHTDIVEMTECYYRKTNGTVYEFLDKNESNQILSDVVSISQADDWNNKMNYLYMVRKDIMVS